VGRPDQCSEYKKKKKKAGENEKLPGSNKGVNWGATRSESQKRMRTKKNAVSGLGGRWGPFGAIKRDQKRVYVSPDVRPRKLGGVKQTR